MGVDGVTIADACRAPLAAEFFRLLGRLEDAGAAAVSREEAMRWAAWARLNLDPWSADLHGLIERATQVDDRERLAIEQVIGSVDASWWAEPMDRGRQLFLGSSADGSLRPPGGEDGASAWEPTRSVPSAG